MTGRKGGMVFDLLAVSLYRRSNEGNKREIKKKRAERSLIRSPSSRRKLSKKQ